MMGVSFDGTTSSTRWLVVDIANDPLGHPNSEVGADPVRPYVSISIAHGIRRFEFMIHADETDEQAEDPAFLRRMLARVVPHPDRVDVIRRRVYTHHSRIAGAFRTGRLLLAGDAAHLMPVWQGQGYNSGIRDAANLGWKLAAVVNGQAGDALLDTYDVERRKHARAMIDLSTMVGRVISPTDRRVAGAARPGHPRRVGGAFAQALCARDAVQADAALRAGRRRALRRTRHRHRRPARCSSSRGSTPATEQNVLLDDVLGHLVRRAVLEQQPAQDPRRRTAFANWKALGARFVAVRPLTQLHWTGHDDPDVVDRRRPRRRAQVLVRRPRRIGVVPAPRSLHRRRLHRPARARAERLALSTPSPSRREEVTCHSATGSVLHVAQPAAESSGAVAGPA